MRLVYLILLLLFPIAAEAAPVIPVLIIIAQVYGASMVVAALIVAQYALGEQKKRREARKSSNEYNASLEERTITAATTDSPYTYVLGRAKVGSAVVAMFTSGDKDQYKHLVCVHAAHECDAIEEIYIAGNKLGTLDENGWVTSGAYYSEATEYAHEVFSSVAGGGPTVVTLANAPIGGTVSVSDNKINVTSSDGRDGGGYQYTLNGKILTVVFPLGAKSISFRVQYRYIHQYKRARASIHLGAQNDGVDSYLHSIFPDKWPATSVLRGFCYTVITLDLNQAEFQGGLPAIEVVMRGAKLYDPRTGETKWSQNPALAVWYYLTSDVCGIDESDLPVSQFITAANVCDELAVPVGGVYEPRYTFNGTITSDQDQQNVLEQMAESMAGGIVPTTWGIYAGKYTAPVLSLDQSDIVGKISITPGVSEGDLYNGVKGQYISKETQYVATDITPYQNQAYVDADNGELWTNIDFPFTDSIQRVHNLARISTEDQRNGYTIQAEFSLKAWKAKVGNRIALNSDVFGWCDKVFRVTGKKFSPTAAVELTIKEDAPEIWDLADAVEVDATPNSELKSPFSIDKIASLSCESGSDALLLTADGTIIPRISVTWPDTAGDYIEIEWTANGTWSRTQVLGGSTQAYLSPVVEGEYYTVRARPVKMYLNLRPDWTYADIHQVVGKSQKPANIENLSISGSVLTWTANTELDLAGYRFRFHYGNNLDWNSAAPLHDGLIVSSPFDLVTRPSGLVSIMGKAVDTSGNESEGTANVIINLGDAPIANVVETFDFGTFAGSLTNCSVVGGDLVADELDSFYGTDNQSAYGLDNDSFYKESAYAQMEYVTEDVSVSSALSGSKMTLEVDSEGVDLSIEYRLVGPGSAYGADSDSFYGEDDESAFAGPSAWTAWPGQIVAANDVYQFKVTVGAGKTQGKIKSMVLTIDAPDIVEYIEDVPIAASGTAIPYTKNFSVIKTVTATLQANTSGAVTIEIDKTNNLEPKAWARDGAQVAVSGANSDFIIKGY